jgi:DNA-binding transcriptional ArsR family regulator
MKKQSAILILAALAQDSRLDAFRLLIEAGPQGMPAGHLAASLKLSPNALTFHLDRLRDAGLVTVRREGRSMIYTAQFETMNKLISYLTDQCCEGRPELCRPGTGKVTRRADASS